MEQMMVRKNRGFRLGQKFIRVFKWVTRKGGSSSRYKIMDGETKPKIKTTLKLGKWGRSIRRGFFNLGNRGYIRVGHDPDLDTELIQVPKGHLAVYVGERDNETRRVLVPVLFLNHPLFGKLLKEAEDVYGFNHPGRIRIPCPMSEFTLVERKIAAGDKRRSWILR